MIFHQYKNYFYDI